MKSSFLTIAILALGCILGGGGRAPAQYSPYSQPSFNPYLNLFRGGGTIGQNYYTLVRPDLNARAGIYGLQQQTQYNQQLITGLQSGYGVNNRFVTTGQPFGFMNHLFYFQNQFRGGLQGGGGIGGGGGGMGGGGMGGYGGGLATGSPSSFGLGGAGGGNMGGAGARPPGR